MNNYVPLFLFIYWFLRQGFSAALQSVLELTLVDLVDYVLFYMKDLIQQVKATFKGFPILSPNSY